MLLYPYLPLTEKNPPTKTNKSSMTEMLLLHIEWGCSRSETVTDISTFSPQGERATEEYIWCHQRRQENCRGRIKNGQAGPHHRWQCKSLMSLYPKGFDVDYTFVLATPIYNWNCVNVAHRHCQSPINWQQLQQHKGQIKENYSLACVEKLEHKLWHNANVMSIVKLTNFLLKPCSRIMLTLLFCC